MFLQRTLACLASAATLSLLAACGSGGNDVRSDATVATPSAAEEPASTPPPAPSASADEPTLDPAAAATRICAVLDPAALQAVMGSDATSKVEGGDVCMFRSRKAGAESIGVFLSTRSFARVVEGEQSAEELTIAGFRAIDTGTQLNVATGQDLSQDGVVVADYFNSSDEAGARDLSVKLLERIMPEITVG